MGSEMCIRDSSKDQHVMMILNEFLNNVGFDDVADALFRVNDEFKQDEFE